MAFDFLLARHGHLTSRFRDSDHMHARRTPIVITAVPLRLPIHLNSHFSHQRPKVAHGTVWLNTGYD